MDSVYCPKCKPKTHKLYPKQLDLIESNYSGCGVDIMSCDTCNTRFQISYKIYEVLDIDTSTVYSDDPLTKALKCLNEELKKCEAILDRTKKRVKIGASNDSHLDYAEGLVNGIKTCLALLKNEDK